MGAGGGSLDPCFYRETVELASSLLGEKEGLREIKDLAKEQEAEVGLKATLVCVH